MTVDEGSDEDAPEIADESSDPSSGGESASRSRFDEFLDRLDEREMKRRRAGDDRDDESKADEEAREPKDEFEPHDAEAITDENGWVWGAPKGTASSVDSPKSADDRIWNELDASVGTDEEPAGGDSDDSVGGVQTSPESSTRDGEDGEIQDRDESSDSRERDRWVELDADLRMNAGKTDKTSSEDWPEVRTSAGAATPNPDPDGSPMEGRNEPIGGSDEISWSDQEPSDAASVSNRDPSSAAAAVSGNPANELGRATSAGSVLVLGPTDRPLSEVICSKFLVGEWESRDALFVTFEDSPNDRIDVCHRADDWAGGEIGIIEVGRGSRNSPAPSEITGGTGGSITVRHVSKPGDLSKLGIVITQLLAEFDESPRRTVLCFHTLSALHNQVGTKTLFRFLNTLQGRLRSADALGHYHMDPDLHDEIVIETLRPIFDVIVRFSADGTIVVE